jgi:transposase
MLLDQLAPRAIVLADKAYDANRIRELIQDQGAAPNIPPKNNPCRKPSFSKRRIVDFGIMELCT